MGVIVKQSFWGTLIAYLGIAVGYLNILYFRAAYLTLEQIGLFTLVTAHAMMISPFSSLGMPISYIKFFPSFSADDKNRFFSFLFLIVIAGNVTVLSAGYLLEEVIASRYIEQAPDYADYLFITGMVILSNSLFDLFFSYSRSIMSIVFPSFIREVYLRLGSLMLVMGYAFSWWSFRSAMYGLGVVYSGAFILLFFQLLVIHKLRFDFRIGIINANRSIKLLKFGSYSMLLTLTYAVYSNIAYDQITTHLGSEANGIFQTCFYIAMIVVMPRINMVNIVNTVISKEAQERNSEEIKSLYQRGSLTMGVIGMLLFIGIITNLEDLFKFIPKGNEFSAGYWVIVFVCFAQLCRMISGFAPEIINFSHLYRYNLIFQVMATLLLITLNHLLIPIWGINGAGIAFLSITLFQIILRFIFVGCHFKMYPLTRSHLSLFIIAGLVCAFATWFQTNWHPIISIALRSVLTAILFILPVYYFSISEDVNKLISSALERFFKIRLSG